MITIYVKHQQSGTPLAGQLLSLEFYGDKIGWTKTAITNDTGSATFNILAEQVTLFVNGRPRYQGKVENGATVFLGTSEGRC